MTLQMNCGTKLFAAMKLASSSKDILLKSVEFQLQTTLIWLIQVFCATCQLRSRTLQRWYIHSTSLTPTDRSVKPSTIHLTRLDESHENTSALTDIFQFFKDVRQIRTTASLYRGTGSANHSESLPSQAYRGDWQQVNLGT